MEFPTLWQSAGWMARSSVAAYLVCCLGYLVIKFLLLLFDCHGAWQEGNVLQMYMILQLRYTARSARADTF